MEPATQDHSGAVAALVILGLIVALFIAAYFTI